MRGKYRRRRAARLGIAGKPEVREVIDPGVTFGEVPPTRGQRYAALHAETAKELRRRATALGLPVRSRDRKEDVVVMLMGEREGASS